MKLPYRLFLAVAVLACFLTGCKPDPVEPDPVPPANNNNNNNNNPPPPTHNAICISFEHVAGSNPLILDLVNRYQNANGDSFSCQVLRYYVSNISFTDDLGNTWYEPESYHLVDAGDTNLLKIYVDSMPAGNYVSMRYMIGVDSARNCSGTQTGALDPANAMFWTWSSGYIMSKFEGHSPASTAGYHLVIFHAGGFGGPDAAQRWITPSFNSLNAVVTNSTVSTIHMKCDMLEWFQTPDIIDFSLVNVANTPGPVVSSIANNYMDAFTVTGIDN